jgi:urea carboxylase
VERGAEIGASYDPMLAKLVALGSDRTDAIAKLGAALAGTRIAGLECNLQYLRALMDFAPFVQATHTTRSLATFKIASHAVDVTSGGVHTMVQDWPARLGYWDVGVPPSGPMDALALRAANAIVGNAQGAAALEITAAGPVLSFRADMQIAVTGAPLNVQLDGQSVAMWTAISVKAGQVLKIGRVTGAGCRAYLAVLGGWDVPDYLGSKSTFTLGQFGGHGGRVLRAGDVLHVEQAGTVPASSKSIALTPEKIAALTPVYSAHWDISVLIGPHGAPDFFTPADMEMLLATDWEVHYNSSRTGVRLIGPKPQWARRDGGEAGLHPSNIHDNPYAIGAIDFTGDMPVILGPDGPSLGGFVCPATVIRAELWKLGQLSPGNTVRFVPVTLAQAHALAQQQDALLAGADATPARQARQPLETASPSGMTLPDAAVLLHRQATDSTSVDVVFRRSGDCNVLIEFGELQLDISLRFHVHALMTRLQQLRADGRLEGIVDLTPGIRSLQVHYDPSIIALETLMEVLLGAEPGVVNAADADISVPSRTVWLPLSWDDAATRLAIDKYMQSVRSDAPWCPSNIEFIRRINGLADWQAVYDIVFKASYLVLGLGDVYLGAPVATPVDPRHRLVTTKYNPARTWTPENAVGIGGAYMCVYGMEGPGGYQFVGRTVQMWNRWRDARNGAQDFEAGKPWLLRFFDQIRFYAVSAEELLQWRKDFPAGRAKLRIEDGTFRLSDYRKFLVENDASIAEFKELQQTAFDAERERWAAAGLLEAPMAEAQATPDGNAAVVDAFDGEVISSQVSGGVWSVLAPEGSSVKAGDPLLVVESMKMEITVSAPFDGIVHKVLCNEGQAVQAGQALVLFSAHSVAHQD